MSQFQFLTCHHYIKNYAFVCLLIYHLYVCIYSCMSLCVPHACETQESPEEGIRAPGTGVTSNVSQHMGAEN